MSNDGIITWLSDKRYGDDYRLRLGNGIEYIKSSRGVRPKKERKPRKELSIEEKLIRSEYMKAYRLKKKQDIEKFKSQLDYTYTNIDEEKRDEKQADNSNAIPN